jgi:cholesterol transport system auxiliary component
MSSAKYIMIFCGVCIVPLLITGCTASSSVVSEQNHYVLDVQRPEGIKSTGGKGVLKIKRLSISSRFESYQFVYRITDLKYESNFYNKFFASPASLITEETRQWLGQSGIFSSVVNMLSAADYDYILEGHIEALYGDYRKKDERQAVLEIRYAIIDASLSREKIAFEKTYAAVAPLPVDTPSGLAEAMNVCMAQILTSLEADLKVLFSSTP